MSATHAGRGRVAELAVGRQARIYAAGGRAWLARQRVQEALARDGRVVRVSQAPCDYIGALKGGQALALEVKQEGGTAVALTRFDEEQREALAALHQLGARVVVLVVFMSPEPEGYVVPWPAIAAFIADPWRASLSRAWCQVEGLAAPCHLDGGELRRIAFLDAAPHPDREQARAEVEAQRACATPKPAPLELERPRPAGRSLYAGLTTDAIRDRIVRATNDGLAHQLRHQHRPVRSRR